MRPQPGRVGLALAGGGPGGAAYEIGALVALEEALAPLDCTAVDVQVGVSAGAFVGACLANGIRPAQLARGLADAEPDVPPMTPEVLFTPAWREFARRGLRLPRLLTEAAWRIASPGSGADAEAMRALARLADALPVALFDGEPLRRYLATLFARPGMTDDFRQLGGRLIVVASDLESAEPIRFGTEGWDHVPISRAVQASAALPGLYPPVNVDGRTCADGVLLRTVHASVALERGVGLLLCVNPIVPVDTRAAVRAGHLRDGALVEGGLAAVMGQTFRTLVHSRMTIGMAAYERRFPGADVVLFEPRRTEPGLWAANIFSFATRRRLCEIGYRATRRHLRHHAKTLAPTFERHGIQLDRAVLSGAGRTVWRAVGIETEAHGTRVRQSIEMLDEALREVEAGG